MKISTAKNYLCSSKNAVYFEPMSNSLDTSEWATKPGLVNVRF